MDLEAALEDARATLEDAEKRVQELTERIPALRAEVQGLELAISRHTGQPTGPALLVIEPKVFPPKVSRESADKEWGSLSRTQAILRMMEIADRPISPADLSNRLRDLGRRRDIPEYVSAALSHLKKQGVVESVGFAQWILKSKSANQEALTS
jgi:hypothetical protein